MERSVEVLDSTSALDSVGGDLGFLAELAGITEAAWATLLQKIREALAEGDFRSLKRSAYLVRVMAGNLFARRAYTAASFLETIASVGDLESAREAACTLEKEMAQLKPVLAELGNRLATQCSEPWQVEFSPPVQ